MSSFMMQLVLPLQLGAERVAFARACPAGNLRLGFHEFMKAVGYVAAQKGMGGNVAAAVVKRTKLSIGPAKVATPRAPGRESVSGGGGGGGARFSIAGGGRDVCLHIITPQLYAAAFTRLFFC